MVRASLSNAWDETRAILARDGRLLASVALALMVLPGMVADLFPPPPTEGALPPLGPWTWLMLATFVLAAIGQLAIIRLALGTRISVGDSIGHAMRRAPVLILASIIWALPFAILLAGLGTQMGDDPKDMPPGVALAVLLLVPVFLFFVVRLILISPVVSAEAVGPIEVLKRSWTLTAGNWWRLFAFLILYLVTLMVVAGAVRSIFTVIAKLVLGGVEPMTIGGLLVSVASQLASAAVAVVFAVMLARIYAQLAGAGSNRASVPKTAD
ncbi:MAG: hypothetical protein ABIO43_06180 [Sphingomicrobium sp.]